jgi:osmotically inducible protein OsmC
MSTLYSTRVTAIGGRAGHVRSDDGILDLPLAMPKELGGKGGATNPEQLFAAGYAACFENAVIHVARRQPEPVRDDQVHVACEVSLLPNGSGGFQLAVALAVTLTGVTRERADEVVALAHAACPYSNAIRGNVDVRIDVAVE